MLSVNTPKPAVSLPHHHTKPLSSTLFNIYPLISKPHRKTAISATLSSSQTPPAGQQLYQPFRPPPSPLPTKFRNLDPSSRFEVLANRLGLWFEYAPLISALIQDGFTPPSIEESTGISSVEQNRLVVAAQVRDSLVQSTNPTIDPETLSFFDSGGAEILYQIRLLSTKQRVAAASFIVERRLDVQGAEELARSIKDFPRRRGDKGWESFDYTLPGDCLSFMYYRQGREHQNLSEEWAKALRQALEFAVTEKAKSVILEELELKSDEGKDTEGGAEEGVLVPVVRMKAGEVGESSVVVVLPVCRAEEKEKEVVEAPWESKTEGQFGVVVAEKGWERWVVLPGWAPVVGLKKGGVVIAFSDARVLPWKANRWYKEEPILVVADRGRKEVAANDGFYLVTDGGSGGGLKVERGLALKELGVKESLATVVLVVRPPRDENDDQLADEDWE